MQEDLVAFLGGTAAISNLVSTRIYPFPPPQNGTLPAITYGLISSTRTYDLVSDLNKVRARVQIDCWGSTKRSAYQVAAAVRNRLSGFYGSMSGTQVHFIMLDTERDLYEEEAGVVGLFRVVQDYIISHLED
jgi:hypothetical protein